jgi:predicted nucleic acid-binding protein
MTLDTSAVVALANRGDPDHARVRGAFVEDGGPYLVPTGILAEICYFLEARFQADVLDTFLDHLERSLFTLDCGEGDLTRIRSLVRRYADLPLGYADAVVIACAERSGGRVLTLDRHFTVVVGEGTIEVFPSR